MPVTDFYLPEKEKSNPRIPLGSPSFYLEGGEIGHQAAEQARFRRSGNSAGCINRKFDRVVFLVDVARNVAVEVKTKSSDVEIANALSFC